MTLNSNSIWTISESTPHKLVASLFAFCCALAVTSANAQSSQSFAVSGLCQSILSNTPSLAELGGEVPSATAFDMNCLAQRSLITIGYLSSNSTIDGFVGLQTSMALERFQSNYGLPTFGIVTVETMMALAEAELELTTQVNSAPTAETVETTVAAHNEEPAEVEMQPAARCVAPLVVGPSSDWDKLSTDLPEECHTHGNWSLNEFILAIDLFRFESASGTQAGPDVEMASTGRLLVYFLPELAGPRAAISLATLSAQASATDSDLMVVRTSVTPGDVGNRATCQLLNAGFTAAFGQLDGIGAGYNLAQVERESAQAAFGLNPNIVGDALLVMIDDGLGFGGFQPKERSAIVTLGLPILELSPSNLQNVDCALFSGLAGSLSGAKLFSPFDPTIGTNVVEDIATVLSGSVDDASEPSADDQTEALEQMASEPSPPSELIQEVATLEAEETGGPTIPSSQSAEPLVAAPEIQPQVLPVQQSVAEQLPLPQAPSQGDVQIEVAVEDSIEFQGPVFELGVSTVTDDLSMDEILPEASRNAAARLEALTNSMAALLNVPSPNADAVIEIVPEPLFTEETATSDTKAVAVALDQPATFSQESGAEERTAPGEYEAVGVSVELAATAEGLNRRRILPEGTGRTVPDTASLASNGGNDRVSLGATSGSALIQPLIETADANFGLDFRYRSVVLPKGLTVPGRRADVEFTVPWLPLPDILNFEVNQNGEPMVWSIAGGYAYPFGRSPIMTAPSTSVVQSTAVPVTVQDYAVAVDPLAGTSQVQVVPQQPLVSTTTFTTANGQPVATVITTSPGQTQTGTGNGDFQIISVNPDVSTVTTGGAVITLPDGTIFQPN